MISHIRGNCLARVAGLLLLLIIAACGNLENASVQETSLAAQTEQPSAHIDTINTQALANEEEGSEAVSLGVSEGGSGVREGRGGGSQAKLSEQAVDVVAQMYEALEAGNQPAYLKLADIPEMRHSPAKTQALFDEARKRKPHPDRFKLLGKQELDEESRELLDITYGSQAEIVLEELSQGDRHVWIVTIFPDGAKVVDQSTIYPGAYELGRNASIEELVQASILKLIDDRQFLASKHKTPLFTPVQTVALIYQAAQEGNEEAFFAACGGEEGFFAGGRAGDMLEFTQWMSKFGSVLSFPIQELARTHLNAEYTAEYDGRFGPDWHFVAAMDPDDRYAHRGTYWILTPNNDATRYVVREAFTTELDPFLNDAFKAQLR
ncbi:hypothetical protein GNP94_04725 [Paenibacillus campinasensis]|uniref:Serine hydrolase n=1 Tax=Paenibacillus campinasensis TaxID=66347 RepID=A0ABW9SWD4_9BACL|nr:hypothetical protein [Paenibacillus campinasensis]MUG65310.1 hypothetical protein [Paenibacillus campinasensis]